MLSADQEMPASDIRARRPVVPDPTVGHRGMQAREGESAGTASGHQARPEEQALPTVTNADEPDGEDRRGLRRP